MHHYSTFNLKELSHTRGVHMNCNIRFDIGSMYRVTLKGQSQGALSYRDILLLNNLYEIKYGELSCYSI